MSLGNSECLEIPILPLRGVVIYPNTITPLFIGRKKSIQCIEFAIKQDKKILLVTQKKETIEDPKQNDLFKVGTIAKIIQLLRLPDGTIKILVKSTNRAKIIEIFQKHELFIAKINILKIPKIKDTEKRILIRAILRQFEKYLKINKKIPIEIINTLDKINDLEKLGDAITTYIPLKTNEKQFVLEIKNIEKRLEFLIGIMRTEIDLIKIEKKIRDRIKNQMEKSQKEYYLNEQMKAIQKELGEIDEFIDENKKLQKKINTIKLPKEVKKKAYSELNKLKMMSSISAEATVVRSYIEWIIKVPWKTKSIIKRDIRSAKKILNTEHFGLNKVKERILEYLVVQNRNKKIKGPILCLVGPPGVGKTSLGKSIANATGRKYIRMALGGIRDEAEIRGHRRTYIGSMPGKLIQKISKIGVKNPLFLLDEIDKISYDSRIDPASALLEVLDSEQNNSFNDHYLEIDYDLSDVMFIATANSLNIPTPLLDRMELIKLSGYTEDEKLNIAKKYLIPKQKKENALKNNEILIQDSAITNIIRYYTREAGVRNLERFIAKICRKTVKKIFLEQKTNESIINKSNLTKYLGIKKYIYGKKNKDNQIGHIIGLAWTEVGGDLLTIESACVPGKGKLTYTGSLGKVMQESIQTALTVVRTQANKLGIEKDFYEKNDIHVHVPEGATPKDGPSAGIAVCTAIISCFKKIPIFSDIAMTGEITLRGKILTIGGLKEKLIAAQRGGIKKVLIPKENFHELLEIPKNIVSKLDIHPVECIEEVLKLSLEKNPYDI